MKRVFYLGVTVSIIALSGCATAPHATSSADDGISPWLCLVGGSLVGGHLETFNRRRSLENLERFINGAIIGGAIGYFACRGQDDTEPVVFGDTASTNDKLD